MTAGTFYIYSWLNGIDYTIQIRLSILMRPDPDPDPSFAHVGKSDLFVSSQQCIFLFIVTGAIIFNILDSTYIDILKFSVKSTYSLALHFAEAGSGSGSGLADPGCPAADPYPPK
jgi:hypothetical protein